MILFLLSSLNETDYADEIQDLDTWQIGKDAP